MPDFPLRFQYRRHSQDEMMIREVFVENCYHLPERFEERDLILDIGAHIGSFTMACLERGAKRVAAFEPSVENFEWLLKNLQYNRPKWNTTVALNRVAVIGGRGASKPIRFTYPGDMASACGHLVPDDPPGSYDVEVVRFDDVVNACEDMIRFCKIDVEGAETSILMDSYVLDKIVELAFEYHGDIMEPMKLRMEQAAFTDILVEQVHPQIPLTQQGLIFARRTELIYPLQHAEVTHGEDEGTAASDEGPVA